MGRTDEQPMPVEETYRDILRAAVKAAGGQQIVADMIGVHQATISRTLDHGQNAA